MPFVALVCRLAAWFVLGAGAAGVVFFLRFDGLGVAVAVFLVVLSAALATVLWAVGRIAAETSRLSRQLAPPRAPARRWRLWRRTPAADAAPAEPDAREMTDAELAEFYGRPESLSAHRAARAGDAR